MKLLPTKGKYSLSLLLLIIFLLVVAGELYLGYKYIYSNVFTTPEEFAEVNVVRVNLRDYEEALEYLESRYNFEPDPIVLPRDNPFQ